MLRPRLIKQSPYPPVCQRISSLKTYDIHKQNRNCLFHGYYFLENVYLGLAMIIGGDSRCSGDQSPVWRQCTHGPVRTFTHKPALMYVQSGRRVLQRWYSLLSKVHLVLFNSFITFVLNSSEVCSSGYVQAGVWLINQRVGIESIDLAYYALLQLLMSDWNLCTQIGLKLNKRWALHHGSRECVVACMCGGGGGGGLHIAVCRGQGLAPMAEFGGSHLWPSCVQSSGLAPTA